MPIGVTELMCARRQLDPGGGGGAGSFEKGPGWDSPLFVLGELLATEMSSASRSLHGPQAFGHG